MVINQQFLALAPKLNNENAFLEPMTTWKLGKKEGDPVKPNLRWLNSLGKAMWRNLASMYLSTYRVVVIVNRNCTGSRFLVKFPTEEWAYKK